MDSRVQRANALRGMKICRFCLDDNEPLSNIYEKDGKDCKQVVPLPLQIMACVALEVFPNDGMPQLICKTCQIQTNQAYNFKTICKKSDDTLKLFLATGELVKPDFNVIQKEDHQEPTPVKKKHEEEPPVPAKKHKSGTDEILTLNYIASTETKKHTTAHVSKNITVPEPPPLIKRVERKESIEEVVTEEAEEYCLEEGDEGEEEDEEEEEEEEEYEEEESGDEHDVTNPILKVPQVKTDVFPCSHCERSFPLKQLLDIHEKNHERKRSFTCHQCHRKFFTKYDLGKHVQIHNATKSYSCVVCQKQFSRESLLHRHEKIHVDVPKYLCLECDRTFLTKEDLDLHSEKHKKRRPFACRLCSKSFVFKQGLERHEITHADQKPHKCNYCEASFTSPIKLTRHITSHAGLRPYPCKLCGRTFLLSHHLTRHMRNHYATISSNVTPVGQHKCDVCSMSFRRKDSLINHSAIHSMVNLKCVICNTKFESAKAVKSHITTHLAGLPYPCDKCDYSFETQDQLEEHEVKHAEMEYEDQIEKEVSAEVQKQFETEKDQEEPEEDEDSDTEVAEFTITNDNLEVVRRSKRQPKIKNYAEFLKDELGSDMEDDALEATESNVTEISMPNSEDETIKPVIRSEGTKVYMRKSTGEKTKFITATPQPGQIIIENPQETASSTSLDDINISAQTMDALSTRKFVDMKVGDKTVRVQKLMMTKAEIEAMAKQGKIEMKGGAIILKNMPPKKAAKDSDEAATTKPLAKKTYVRKQQQASGGGEAAEDGRNVVETIKSKQNQSEDRDLSTTLELKVDVAQQSS